MRGRKTFLHIFLLITLSLALLLTSSCGSNKSGSSVAGEINSQSTGSDEGGDSKNEELLSFSDPVFEALLKTELGLNDIYPSDLDSFTGIQIVADQFLFLSGPDRPGKSICLYGEDTFEYEDVKYTGYGTIKTLEDIQYFSSLSTLKIVLQPNIDTSTIPNIDNFTQINFTHSKLADIGFLADAVNLTVLSLSTNDITDISSIVNCKKLKLLDLNYNHVSDLTPIGNLTSLNDISFYDNEISDISPLKNLTSLTDIGMYQNAITDISVLSDLPNLTYVELINNQINDVSPLENFQSFDRLALTGNPIENIAVLAHIDNLEY